MYKYYFQNQEYIKLVRYIKVHKTWITFGYNFVSIFSYEIRHVSTYLCTIRKYLLVRISLEFSIILRKNGFLRAMHNTQNIEYF